MLSPARKLLKSPGSPQREREKDQQGSNEMLDRGVNIMPISALSSFSPRNWGLKGRCISKQPIHEYVGRDSRAGKSASVDIIDESGEIHITMFNEVLEVQYKKFEVNKVFIVSKGNIRPANKKFCKSEYEVILGDESLVEEVAEQLSLPSREKTFIPQLSDLGSARLNDAQVDLVGVIVKVEEVSEQISKKQLGQTFAKRSIIVVDESEYQIELTLWREQAVQFNGNVGDVIVAVNTKIAEFNGFRSATVSNQTNLEINPKDISRVSELQKWFRRIQSEDKEKIEHNLWKKIEATGGKSGTDGKEQKVAHSVSTQQLKQTDVDQLDKGAEFFNVIGAITYFKRTNLWYLACPNTKCSRKIQDGDQSCKSCGHNLIADGPGVKRYILSLLLSDSEGSI
ncbi:MAG: putative Replication protein A 70 kDa DNA-binding subunit, partial [Streblomastix strix]